MAQPTPQKVALITGCGKGSIGEGLAMQFLAHGYRIIPTVLPGESRKHLEVRGSHPHDLDLTDEKSIAALYDFVVNLGDGRLDVLGNNAGVGYLGTAVDIDFARAQGVFDVHLFGAMRMVNKFNGLIVRSKGLIFNTCSISGKFPTPWSAVYGAAKAGLIHYGRILRVELAPLGVNVVNLLTGEVHTNILKPLQSESIPSTSVMAPMNKRFIASLPGTPGPHMSPEAFAKGVVPQLIAKNPSRDVWYGNWAGLLEFMCKYLPQWVADAFATSMFYLNELKA